MMREWLRYFSKRIKIRKYAYEFAYYLAREYSVKDGYTATEIERVIAKYRFAGEFNYYAHALFSTNEEYKARFANIDNIPSYDNCRMHVAKILKLTNNNFGFHELITKSRFQGAITVTKNDKGEYIYIINNYLDSTATGGH